VGTPKGKGMTFTHCVHWAESSLASASDEAASGEAIDADEGLQERFSWETRGFIKQ